MSNASSAWWKAFRQADSSVYSKAFFEILVIGGLSIMPLALAAYGTFLLQATEPTAPRLPLINFLSRGILSGQLYFYAISFIATVIWHSGQDMKKPFPPRIAFWSISFLLGMLCAFFFGISPALPNTGIPELSILSVFVYLISAIMYFLILSFREIDPPDLEKTKRDSESDLQEKVRRRRGISE